MLKRRIESLTSASYNFFSIGRQMQYCDPEQAITCHKFNSDYPKFL
ncbi:hypothetical protein THF1C08_340007 [Vibrio jasicida]|uniref:Uncharacterized protein n=1 Tax=Vibrio jasicida TaxID=766224 RepID=A0AAU9QQ54_9VIBR|nr:hypothetical protein THF1C08_340007 [Vibrio jasicida]CAH1598148.1 hypothetical protein THF1A12_350007 [Vibrio jasicida]